MIPEVDGIYAWVPEDVYHGDRGSLSVSGAKLLLPPSCPARFKEQQDNPPPPKRVFDFGSLTHKLVLGKGADIVTIDAPDFRTKDAREQRDQAHAEGKVPALVSEVRKAQAMATKALEHPVAGPLFDDGAAEHSVYAVDPETGVRLRCRPDWITSREGRPTIVDYKTSTTANPDDLTRKFYQLGYFMQAAWYIDVCQLAGVAVEPEFLFVVQEKEPPHLVTVGRYTQDAIAEGRRRNRQAITIYADCVAANQWPGYTDTITTLALPYWAQQTGVEADADALIAELEGLA